MQAKIIEPSRCRFAEERRRAPEMKPNIAWATESTDMLPIHPKSDLDKVQDDRTLALRGMGRECVHEHLAQSDHLLLAVNTCKHFWRRIRRNI